MSESSQNSQKLQRSPELSNLRCLNPGFLNSIRTKNHAFSYGLGRRENPSQALGRRENPSQAPGWLGTALAGSRTSGGSLLQSQITAVQISSFHSLKIVFCSFFIFTFAQSQTAPHLTSHLFVFNHFYLFFICAFPQSRIPAHLTSHLPNTTTVKKRYLEAAPYATPETGLSRCHGPVRCRTALSLWRLHHLISLAG